MSYTVTNRLVEVFGPMTETQFRSVIEEILGQPRARFKDWSEHFVFEANDAESLALCSFLRREDLPHSVTTEATWDA